MASSAKTPEKVDAMDEFRILCAMREGSWELKALTLVRKFFRKRKSADKGTGIITMM